MSIRKYYSWRIIIVFTFFCLIQNELYSQCNPPNQLPTIQCEDAPVVCLQNACYSTTEEQDPGWNGFCDPNSSINNPQYFEIVPVDTCVEIHILAGECMGSVGIQSALVTHCNWQPCPGSNVPCPDILDCDPGVWPGVTMVLDACGVTPGVPLWLIIDGSNGAICEYSIEYVAGIFAPQIEEEITEGSATPSVVCQGYDNLVLSVAPEITNASGYAWYTEWNGNTITSSTSEVEIDIAANAPTGIWNVCVTAFSGCDSTEVPFCFPVEIYDGNETTASICCDHVVCDSPCTFVDIILSGTPPWSVVVSDGSGLDTITGIQSSPYTHFACELDSGTVQYSLIEVWNENDLCSGELNSDSVVVLEVAYDLPQPYVIQTDTTLCAGPDPLTYSWYSCGNFTLLSTMPCFTPPGPGCYIIVFTHPSGCQATEIVDFLASIDHSQSPGISIFPNPSKGNFKMLLSDNSSLPLDWIIYDNLGKKLESGKISGSETEMQFQYNLSPGLYFLKVVNEFRQEQVFKIVIE